MKKVKKYTIRRERNGRVEIIGPKTLPEFIEYFSYTLRLGKEYQHEKGNKKINTQPKTIKSLIINLQNAKDNAARNGHSGVYYYLEEEVVVEE